MWCEEIGIKKWNTFIITPFWSDIRRLPEPVMGERERTEKICCSLGRVYSCQAPDSICRYRLGLREQKILATSIGLIFATCPRRQPIFTNIEESWRRQPIIKHQEILERITFFFFKKKNGLKKKNPQGTRQNDPKKKNKNSL